MDPTKDLFPAFPPPIKTIIPIPKNLCGNFSQDMQNCSENVLYQYLPISSSGLKCNHIFNNEIQGNNDFHQSSNTETKLELVSEHSIEKYPNGNDISKTINMNNFSTKIDQFLKTTKQKFKKEILKRHISITRNLPETVSRSSIDHELYKPSANTRNTQYYDLDRPQAKKYKKNLKQEESLTTFMDNSFDNILAKALKDVESRRKSLDDQRFQTGNFSENKTCQDKFLEATNLYLESEHNWHPQINYKDKHVGEDLHEPAADNFLGSLTNRNISNMLDKRAHDDNSLKFERMYADMQNNLAEEIVQFFTEEKVTIMTQLMQQKHNNLLPQLSKQEANGFSTESWQSCPNIVTDNNYSSGAINKSTEEIYNILANEQTDWDNMSKYSLNMDISPKSGKRSDKFAGNIANNTLDSKSIEKESSYDQGNKHYYSSPEYKSDCSSANIDYSVKSPLTASPNRDQYFSLRNERYSPSPEVINYEGPSKNTSIHSPRYRDYNFSPMSNITCHSKERSPNYNNNFEQIDELDEDMYSIVNFPKTQPESLSPRNYLACDEHESFLRYSNRSISPCFIQFKPKNHGRFDISPKSSHSSFSLSHEKEIQHRRNYTHSSKRYVSPLRYERRYSPRCIKEYSPIRGNVRQSSHDRHQLTPICHNNNQSNSISCNLPKWPDLPISAKRDLSQTQEHHVKKKKKLASMSKISFNYDKYDAGDLKRNHEVASNKLKVTEKFKAISKKGLSYKASNLERKHNVSSIKLRITEKSKGKYKMGNAKNSGNLERNCNAPSTKLTHRGNTANGYDALDSYDLLVQHDYGAFADTFLSECNSNTQTKVSMPHKRLNVHERLGPQQPSAFERITFKGKEKYHYDDMRLYINSKRK